MEFAALGVSEPVVGALAEQGVTSAFPIQQQTVQAALEGNDICGKAPTGSGKTLAFGIPVVDLVAGVERAEPWHPVALILAPTRELATQIHDDLAPLVKARKRRIATVFGGRNIDRDIRRLEKAVDILVACPGRLEDLISRRAVELRHCRFVVIDEADRMADMGFLPSVRRIVDQTPADRHTLLFSATLDGEVDTLIKRYQNDPVVVEVADPVGPAGEVTHSWHLVEAHNRIDIAARLLASEYSAIAFCRTRRGCDRVAKMLSKRGVAAVAIHGDRSQPQRERALANFASGDAQVLVATDVAARGIHVDNVGLVLHYDPAGTDKDYIHRSGRTGRAGQPGRVVSLVPDDKKKPARALQRDLGHKPGFDDLDLDALPDLDQVKAAGAGRAKAKAEADRGERSNRGHLDNRGDRRNKAKTANKARTGRGAKRRGERRGPKSRNKSRGDDAADRDRDPNNRPKSTTDRDNRNPNNRRKTTTDRDRDNRNPNNRRRKSSGGTKDWYPPGWNEQEDRPAGGRNTTKRKSRAAKGRHADRNRNKNKGKRRSR